MSTPETTPEATPRTAAQRHSGATAVRQRPRIHQLDALRGFAMCGIVFMNILQMSGMPQPSGPSADLPAAFGFALLFDQRFAPIFAFMFGLSFALFLWGPAQRHQRPRSLLLRRLLVLGVLGLAHGLLQPGEVLRFYAVFGLVFLLPASYLPRRWVLGVSIMLIIVPVVLALNSVFLVASFVIPGLLLLGTATYQYGIPDTLQRRGRQLMVAFGVLLVLAVAAGVWQYLGNAGVAGTSRAQLTGLVFAPLFAVAFLLALRGPLRGPLAAVFEPLGRMALTNYLLATLLILLGNGFLHLEQSTQYGTIVLLGIGIGVVQAAISPLWLRRFRYGPAEWVWRCLTWWERVPLRR